LPTIVLLLLIMILILGANLAAQEIMSTIMIRSRK